MRIITQRTDRQVLHVKSGASVTNDARPGASDSVEALTNSCLGFLFETVNVCCDKLNPWQP